MLNNFNALEKENVLPYVIFTLFVFMLPQVSFAHEAWLLTPEQIIEWNLKPKPEIFTQFTLVNVSMIVFSLIMFFSWIALSKKESFIPFKRLQVYLSSVDKYVPFVVRLTLSAMLIIAAFGLNPRHGTDLYEASTLVAPDLEIRTLSGNWNWLAWAQASAAFLLLAGVYVRTTAFIILIVGIIGVVIFGYQMWAYMGILAASTIFLLFQGGGLFSMKVWMPAKPLKILLWFERQTSERAQFLLRVLTGLNLVYLGIEYKFFHPNLSMAFLELQNVYTFGLEYSVFTFGMFLVEALAGLLMIMGVLIRPLSVILFCSFIFIGYITGENPIGHIIIYGILYSCFINGKGCWSPSHVLNAEHELNFNKVGVSHTP